MLVRHYGAAAVSDVAAQLTQYSPHNALRVARFGTPINDRLPTARFLEVDGTLVFADVSGFTALSERLAKQGRIGAELVNQLLSISFTAMLEVALGLGGDLISFGGDSLCLLFEGESHVQRAVAASHGLRASLRRTSSLRAPIDKGTLRVSTGVHTGPIVLALVGETIPMLVTIGNTLTRTLRLEADSEPGEVLMSHEVRDCLLHAGTKWASIENRPNSVCALTGIQSRSMPWLSPAPTADVDRASDLIGIDPAIRAELQSGRSGLEHHPATIAFLHYENIDRVIAEAGVEKAVAALHRLMTVVQEAASRENVTVLATDVDQDGGKIVLSAGIPRSSGLEDDRMLATVRHILDSDIDLPIRIGVHAGMVFAGPVGSPKRASFTTIGDAMNTTARIMAKAAIGEALVSPVVLQGARTTWSAVEVAPFAAKGKSAYLRASSLGTPQPHVAPKPAGPTRLPFRGRDREISEIERAIDEFRKGRPEILELVGDGGLGKSRLIEETLWRLGDLRVIHINGSPFAKTQGYFALQAELRLAAGLPEEGDVSDALRELILRELPAEEPLLPLFGAAFGCAYPETKESSAVAEQFRSRLTNTLVGRLINAVVGRDGVVLVVDDSHWLDDASCALVRSLIDDEGRNWFYLVARRPEPSFLDLADRSSLRRIELTQLDQASAFALAESFAVKTPLSDETLQAAVDRADGNPLLLELVLEAVGSGASIHDLPEEAERLISARFDALSQAGRELLRAASVLGMDVSSGLLSRLLDRPQGEVEHGMESVADYLIPESVGAYRFRHALVRETAYEGLAFAVRRRLHAAVVEAIEAGVPHVGETVSLLAIHSVAASLHDRTWKYARTATDVARSRGLLGQAADLARAAVAAAKFVDGVTAREAASVWETLGDVERLSGRPMSAQKAFTNALRGLESQEDRSRVMWKRAESQVDVHRYTAADGSLDQILALLADDRSPQANCIRADALTTKAGIRYRRGKNPAAVRLLNEAWAAAERADDDNRRARINFIYGAVETELGSRHAEFYLSEAVRLLRASGRRVELARALNNFGYFEHYNGRWDRALQFYEESARVSDSAGDVVNAATSRNNTGEILSDRGEVDEAARLFVAAQRTFNLARFSVGSALVTLNLGRVAMRRGDFETAHSRLRDAAQRFTEMGVASYAQEANGRIAECLFLEGRFVEAIDAAEIMLKPLRDSGQNPTLEATVVRILGSSQLELGLESARTTLLRALSLAEAFRVRFDQLLVLEGLARVSGGTEEEQAEQRITVSSLRRSLGIRTSLESLSPRRQTKSSDSVILDLSGPEYCSTTPG